VSLEWLRVFIAYFVVVYVFAGGMLVNVFELASWRSMIWLLIGCLLGHWIGYKKPREG
jgi:membrane protein DedA with SNARE-associated domain